LSFSNTAYLSVISKKILVKNKILVKKFWLKKRHFIFKIMIIKNLLIFFYDFIFFGGSWVGAAVMRPPSLKKRLGGRRPPSKTPAHPWL